MRPSSRVLPFALLLAFPGAAWAGGNAVVLPIIPNGVDSKVSNNLTSLLSSELDFSGAFETVNDLPAPGSLNASCLTSTKCLGAIAKDSEADAVVAGSVSTGGAGLKISLVLYDAGKNAIVGKKSYDIAADVASVAGAAPKMAKELLGQGSAAAGAAAAGPGEEAFADDEDFSFDGGSDVKGKTKFTPDAKKGKLVDVDDEDDRAAETARRREESEAKMKAEARAKAESEAKAKAAADAKARADAEAKAKADAGAKARAKAEAEERARDEAEAAARASAARKKAAPVEEDLDEDLEAELAAFSFDGGGKVAAVAPAESEPARALSFSERYGSSSGSKSDEKKSSSSSSKSTASKARVQESDDDEDYEEEEEAPRSTSRASASRAVEEEEEEEEAPRAKSRASTSRASEEDEDDSSSRSRSSSSTASRSSSRDVEDEEEDRPRSSRARLDEEDEPIRRAGNSDASARFGVAARGGYARYGSLDFITYGAELDIPVASRVVLLLGVEGASTNRNYTDEERAVIATAAGILPEQVQDWNAILPINFGIVYKVPTTAIQPYIGVDGLAVAYTATPDFAFGGRLRGGCDFMLSDNFGFNLDVGLGVLSGEQFDLIQAGLADTGFYPEVSGGTVLSF
jgi:hypothetical protein